MFSTIWGICFSLEANLNGLKTSGIGTVEAQRERVLVAGRAPSAASGMKRDFVLFGACCSGIPVCIERATF
jgi:hypothetical protein